MIYLLAILWFASGFFGCAYITVVGIKEDFTIPSANFFTAIGFGIFAPLMWAILIWYFWKPLKLPQITLFKARNK